jgi:hypothetical protein
MTAMKIYLGLVVAFAIGCGVEPDVVGTSEAALGVTTCDDPFNCLRNNGGGVYTQELGNAGIGPYNFMITHFINLHPGVEVRGRYWVGAGTGYGPGIAEIVSAHVDQTVGAVPLGDYRIIWVSENLTKPTFMLADLAGHPVGMITGTGLLHLQIRLKLPGGRFTVSFAGYSTDPIKTTGDTPPVGLVEKLDMQWNTGDTVSFSTRQSYCTLAPEGSGTLGGPDPVVFQQGIIVNPLNAKMTSDNDYVTLSCRNGAMATVRSWGYVYRGTQTQSSMFEAAMEMKRASYCGDESFYTRAGTYILVKDSADVNADGAITPSGFEASWGLTSSGFRALCVKYLNRRVIGADYPPGSGLTFHGQCDNAPSIPLDDCAFSPPQSMWLIDQLNRSL